MAVIGCKWTATFVMVILKVHHFIGSILTANTSEQMGLRMNGLDCYRDRNNQCVTKQIIH